MANNNSDRARDILLRWLTRHSATEEEAAKYADDILDKLEHAGVQIINPREHIRFTHTGCDDQHCNICNLFICSVCGGTEGTLTTECPGYRLSHEVDDGVFKELIDFRGGAWICGKHPHVDDSPRLINQALTDKSRDPDVPIGEAQTKDVYGAQRPHRPSDRALLLSATYLTLLARPRK
jgi:hypothetical protein